MVIDDVDLVTKHAEAGRCRVAPGCRPGWIEGGHGLDVRNLGHP